MERIPDAAKLALKELRSFVIDGEAIAVFRKAEDSFYTFADACTHDGAPISDGSTEGDLVVCPRHGAKFDMRDGSVQRMPASSPLEIYPNEWKDGELYVDLDS
jgi:3-phenylpropionate/trans-cinnamate dioxygenase ferredoxin subunit